MEPQPIVEMKFVTDTDRNQLIHFISQRPMIWCKDVPKEKAQLEAMWVFMAQALTGPGRGFDVKLTKKIWKNLRDQYVKIMKSDDPKKSNWRYLQPMAFLGTDFGPKKPKVVKDGSEPAKKKSKKKEASEETSQEATSSTQQPTPDQYFPHQQFGQQMNGQYMQQGQFPPQQFGQANGMNPEMMNFYQQQQMSPSFFQHRMPVKTEPEHPQVNNFMPNQQQSMFSPSRVKFEHGQPQVNAYGSNQQQMPQYNYGQPMQQHWNQTLSEPINNGTKTGDEHSGYITSGGTNYSSPGKPSSVPLPQVHAQSQISAPVYHQSSIPSFVSHQSPLQNELNPSVANDGQDPHRVFAQLRVELADFIRRLADLERKLD